MAAIRIHTDENVHPGVARGLQRRGVNAASAVELGTLTRSDEEQLEVAAAARAILFTHDADFIAIARQWSELKKDHWGVIFVHKEQYGVGECIRRLREYAEILQAEDMLNRVEYL